ncbi:MAG TPA: hypothetical protein VNZ64_27880 [Candidatus Acidoferrum sp.]|nr:hypothetical protein [Candidatus Acidoferrum sp.]
MCESKASNKTVGGRRRLMTLAAFAVWLLAMTAAAVWMTRYTGIPGPAENAPEHWPAQSTIGLNRTNFTLVMFAHPHCPCTQASLGELERLMARTQGRMSAYVLFLQPARLPASWAETSLRRQATAIPGVEVQMDADGTEARRFGATTSGDAVVYAADGSLQFHGGITISRGHEGDNTGLSALVALSRGQPLETTQASVFGCSLFETQCRKTGHP